MIRMPLAARLVLALVALSLPVAVLAQRKPPTKTTKPAALEATTYLTPTCGCCGKWVEHLESAGFKVKREVTSDLESVAPRQRVPIRVRTCHTAVVGKYLVEGHVPVDVVKQMLREAPDIAGIAVPGMPIGSPGMEGPNPRSYSVIAFKADGSTYEYARR